MLKMSPVILLLGAIALQAQTWLNPDSFPKALACDTSRLILPYQEYCNGTRFYEVRPTPGGANPVIDGLLENNIWAYAETLLINSWEDAGRDASCDDRSRKFNGPKDFHAIWRFCYNAEGLFVGVEVHDDKWTYGGVKNWTGQDCIEMAIDPWDWGCAATGGAENCNWGQGIFRRYWSNSAQIIPYSDDAQKAFVRLIKRAADEPYLVGLVRGTLKNNYTPGEEGTNFVRGASELRGIDFRCQYAGTDLWGRSVIHFEFKIPFHTTLWDMLDNNGFYDNGLPRSGNLFKMNFTNDDDDGSSGGNSFLRTRNFGLKDGFVNYDCHWSDTRYMMAFKYSSRSARAVCSPYPDNSGPIVLHGHPSITDIWEDTSAAYYDFTKGGTIQVGGVTYFYDSTLHHSGTGTLVALGTNELAAEYQFVRPDSANDLKDTLILNWKDGTSKKLLRRMALGLSDVEGRWVKAHMSICSRGTECAVADTHWTPVPEALEYRFCPLTRFNKTNVTNPEYQTCSDSVRVYLYGQDVPRACYTYDGSRLLLGRDSVIADFEIRKIVRAASAPRCLLLRNRQTGKLDTLAEIQPYPLIQIGESGTDITGTLINARQKRMSSLSSATDSINKLQILDKYNNSALFFPTTPTAPVYGTFYTDGVVLVTDNTNSRYWSKLSTGRIQLDTNYLMAYDSIQKKSLDGCVPKPANELVAPDLSWIEQVCTFVIEAKPGELDSFVCKDTTHIQYADYHYDLGARRNTIDTSRCRPINCTDGIERAEEVEAVKVLAVDNFPNPFNPFTILRFAIPPQVKDARYALNIYNLRGQLIRTLEKGNVGRFGIIRKVVWDGTDNLGMPVGAGIYFYRLSVGEKMRKGSLVLVR